MPKLSIITPVYNTPLSALRSCIASVKAQTFQDWEWCMVDDASPNSKVHAVLRKAAASDPRIRVAFRSANGGIVAASQDALDMATGEFIALLDHDDELHPRRWPRLHNGWPKTSLWTMCIPTRTKLTTRATITTSLKSQHSTPFGWRLKTIAVTSRFSARHYWTTLVGLEKASMVRRILT